MREMPSKGVIVSFIMLGVGICALLFLDFGKSHSLVIDSILNFGHVPLFFLITAMVLWVLDWSNWPVTGLKNYIRAFVISLFLAVLTEALQILTPERSFQFGDIIYDVIGSVIFLLVSYQHKRSVGQRSKKIMNVIAGILSISAMIPVISAGIDEIRATHDFPLLGSFESFTEISRWRTNGATIKRGLKHATHGEFSLMVTFSPGLYPGITMNYPPRDWRNQDILSFDIFLEEEKTFELIIRINDLLCDEEYEDRYKRTISLIPGANYITIPLSEVEQAPKDRKFEMGHISVLSISSFNLTEHRIVYVDNIRLEKRR